MAEEKGAPPGLEALANHLGYTFIKKDDTDSTSASEESTADAKPDSAEDDKKDADGEKKDEDEKKDEEKPKVPKGSLTSSGSIFWHDKDETWTATEPSDLEPAENEDTEGHAVLIRQTKSEDSRKKYEIHSLIIQSPQLKVALGEILDDYPGVCCNLDRLVFDRPFEPFIHRWGALLEYMKKEDLDSVTKDHLELLHGIVIKDSADTIKAFEDYVSNGVVTYEHAWIVFQPGAVVVAPSVGKQMIALRLKSGSYEKSQEQGNNYRLWCERVDWDGKAFGWADEYVMVRDFKGFKPIHELPAFPLPFHPNKEQLKSALIERGKKWAGLAGVQNKSYNGLAIQRMQDGNVLVQTDGRIIIDAESFCKQWDQCKIFINPLNSSNTEHNESDPWDNPVADGNTELSLRDTQAAVDQKLTDYQYMLCTPLLRGYSLKSKKWLSFYVPFVSEIDWNDRAFEGLVLPQSQKRLVLALSNAQNRSANSFDDIISGKGKGMILLLSGPPGVGKTLTAEAVSESMKVPLFMMSAGDLGVRPDEVEQNLESVLEKVAKWKAILLIDECDVFLEARSAHDLDRNRLVSIFLRLLEYYKGTLFLTTNRADNIDPAFQSRIHIHLQYSELSKESRKTVWKSFLDKTPSQFAAEELDQVSEIALNGRQIKNIVKTAQLVAMEEDSVLRKEHIDTVMGLNATL